MKGFPENFESEHSQHFVVLPDEKKTKATVIVGHFLKKRLLKNGACLIPYKYFIDFEERILAFA